MSFPNQNEYSLYLYHQLYPSSIINKNKHYKNINLPSLSPLLPILILVLKFLYSHLNIHLNKMNTHFPPILFLSYLLIVCRGCLCFLPVSLPPHVTLHLFHLPPHLLHLNLHVPLGFAAVAHVFYSFLKTIKRLDITYFGIVSY